MHFAGASFPQNVKGTFTLDLTPSTRQVNLYLILIQGVFFLRVFLKLYAGQEATARTGHGTTDWFQIGKGVRQGEYCHPAYLTCMQRTS